MSLSGAQLNRYMRHIDMPEIGQCGQRKLLDSRVLIIGAGGLGAPAALYLTAAGVGKIGIVDDDTVDTANLQRQILYRTQDVKRKKVLAAKETLKELCPEAEIVIYDQRFQEENGPAIIDDYDLVIDGSDNFQTRFFLNRLCLQMQKPLVSASLYHFDGQITTFKPYLGGDHPCYECLYPASPQGFNAPSCVESGVLGPLAGVMGTMLATEAIKELLSIGKSLSGYMLVYSSLHAEFQMLKIYKNNKCLACLGAST